MEVVQEVHNEICQRIEMHKEAKVPEPLMISKEEVKSVLTGAAVNVALNALLIPHFGAMGAVAATLAAELSVPVVQFIILRRELPFGRYVRYAATYAVIGIIMAMAVRIAAMLPLGGWLGLGVQVAVGGVTYIALCLVWWKITGNRHILGILKKSAKPGK